MFRISLILILFVALISLACNLGLRSNSEPTPQVDHSTPSPGNRGEMNYESDESGKANGRVELTFDESEVTDLVASELENVEETSISDIQVFLRDGQVQVFGSIQLQGIRANSRIFLDPQVTRQGEPRFVIVSAYYSLIPIPENIVSNIQAGIDEIFSNHLEPLMMDVTIESISVSEGLLTITGSKN